MDLDADRRDVRAGREKAFPAVAHLDEGHFDMARCSIVLGGALRRHGHSRNVGHCIDAHCSWYLRGMIGDGGDREYLASEAHKLASRSEAVLETALTGVTRRAISSSSW